MPVGALADRHTVGRQIKDLAGEPGLVPRRTELAALADALHSTDAAGLDPWADLDLLHAYARPESVTPVAGAGEEHRAWSWLEAVLGALVFVPLMLTWYGLTQASSAYEALTGADPKAAARPFLQLWQSGFEGHLTGAFTFGHVAMGATVAIVLLFALVLVHGFRRSAVTRREEHAQREADRLMRRLVPVLTQAQLVLNVHRMASPQRFAAELTGAAATLNRLGTKSAKAQKDLSAAAEVVGDAVQQAERRLAGIDTSVRPLEDAAGRIEEAVRGSGKEIEAAVSGNGVMVCKALEDVRSTSGDVRDVLDRAGDRVEDSVTALAASQRSFTTGIEVASDVTAQVLARLGDVTEESARGAAESQAVMRQLAEQSGSLRDLAERFAQLVDALRAVPLPAPEPSRRNGVVLEKLPEDAPASLADTR
ncbi:hypothetical protein [Streptomyces agglomeratus]|uniref:hypothetical protein n=1 Tax=Streptomyces agglomeratus TaxID=285458 RepID=UPI000B0FE024|nr:hypothetical protein [Streptomyces agglomeratus]